MAEGAQPDVPHGFNVTARDAADRGYKVVVVDDGCLTFDQELHDTFLRSFAVFLGNVKTAAEVIAALATQGGPQTALGG